MEKEKSTTTTNYGCNEEYEGNDVDEDDQGEKDIFDEEGEGLREGKKNKKTL